MKTLLMTLALLLSVNAFADDEYVKGYMRKNGTYVEGYHRTTEDNSVNNNYSTSGNLNPYSGQSGHEKRNEDQGDGSYNSGNGEGSTGSHRRHRK